MALDNARIAILMSVYRGDHAAYLKLSVESILQQSYQNFIFFIIADGNLPEELDSYLDSLEDRRVVIRKRSNNIGLAASLNELIDYACTTDTFDFFARMDADDISEGSRLQIQLDFFNNNSEIDIVGTWYNTIDSNGKNIGSVQLPTSHDQLIAFMARRSPVAHPSVMLRSRVFAQGYRYDSNFGFFQDYDLWVRLAASKFKFANIPLCLLNFREDQNFFKRRASFERALNNSMTSFRHIRNFKLYSIYYLVSPILLFFLRIAPPAIARFAYRNFRNYRD